MVSRACWSHFPDVSYLLDLKLWEVKTEFDPDQHEADVVAEWAAIVASLSHEKLPILCFDSHYSSKAALDHLKEGDTDSFAP